MIHTKVEGGEVILAAGPLTKQPSSRPYRIVIVRRLNGELTVHNQFFRDDLPADAILSEEKSDLANGNYFKSDELVKATQKFAERLERTADYLQSLYRETAQ